MADAPSWRQGYDAIEREVAPRLESLVRSDSFAVAVGLVARLQRTVEGQASRTTRRMLHQLNLPAGTDVARILNELGQLRRQVRELRDELEETKAALTAARETAPAGRNPTGRTAAGRKRSARKPAARKTAARGGSDGAGARS